MAAGQVAVETRVKQRHTSVHLPQAGLLWRSRTCYSVIIWGKEVIEAPK
jgi:hypothetical protein